MLRPEWIPQSDADADESLDVGREMLWDNGYPGRWLAIGRSDQGDDKFHMAYAIGGRSDGSKNRIFVPEGDAFRTVAPDKTAEEMESVPDAALIYYQAIAGRDGVFVVSNGAQTPYILDTVVEGASFEDAVMNAPKVQAVFNGEEQIVDPASFEPDSPNFTPRISGLLDLRPNAVTPFGLSVVTRNLEDNTPDHRIYTADLDDIEPGRGYAIQTYASNDPDDSLGPLPSFDEDPYLFFVWDSRLDIAERLREAIGERTFAASVVRSIDVATQSFRGSVVDNDRG